MNNKNPNKTTKSTKDKGLIFAELRYRRLFEAVEDGILLVDFNTGIILNANRFLINLFGYSKKDFLKKYLWEVNAFKSIFASKDSFATLRKKKSTRFEDLLLETKTKKKIYVKFTSNLYWVGDATIIQCNFHDITDCRQVEEALWENEEKYKDIFNNVRDEILYLDTNGRVVDVNPRVKEIFGWTPEEVIGKDFTKIGLFKKQDERMYRAALRDVIVAGESKTPLVELSLKDKNGKDIFVEASTDFIKRDGKVEKVLLTVRDIRERKKAREKMEFNNIVLHTQQETSLDGILIVDPKGEIISFNQHFVDMWGIPLDVIKLKSYERTQRSMVNKLIDPDEFIHKIKYLYEARNEKSRDRIALKNGRIFDYYSAPMSGAEGKYYGRVWYFRDITKEAEIDKAKTEFVSLASHELRTPLTAIDGITAMIRAGEYGEVSSNLKQPLEDINTSSERLIHLVNDLLSLARMQAGRLKYRLVEVDIKPTIEKAISLLQIIAKPKGLKLSASDMDSANVLTDVDKLEQILDNIIGNSLKFTDTGSVTVSTRVAGDKVEVYITDTGIGIAEENQAKLFGRFEQLESGLDRPAGTGLGLYISREMIRKMGGDLWLEKSKSGVGSTFAFSLPLAKLQLATKVKAEIERENIANSDQETVDFKVGN
jgi:PAS domain S-box-containing protein